MGIPVYFKTCIEDYNNICIPLNKNNNIIIDNLFFDLNCLIHPCCHGEINENKMFENIFLKMKNIINVVNPQKMIFIAIDGPCPKPKMVQQRLRRFKSAKEKKIWDTNSITPGTQFMINLENYLLNKINNFNKKIIFSSFNEPGEGEHKIFNYIRKNNIDSNIIYGLDADLIMLSLISNSKKIYLLRETTEYNIENVDSEYIYLNIYNLKKNIINKIKPKYCNINNNTLINDYIFICFFIGNDFIQHTPSINIRYNGLEDLLDIYNKLSDKYNGLYYLTDITKNEIINMKNFKEFIYELSLNENDRLKKILNIRRRQEKKFKSIYHKNKDNIRIINHKPIIFRSVEKKIFINLDDWRKKYYMETIFHIVYNEKVYPIYEPILNFKIKDMCKNYLESLKWTLHYYLRGCIAWRFSYKYYYAPSFVDVYNYLKDIEIINIKLDNKPYSCSEQLNMVLPKESFNLIKDKDKIKINENMYPEKVKESYLLKRYLWECNPILPHL
jgi:5'-3' exonuclease